VTDLAQPAPQLQTWKLTLAYDGTDFSGWQIQPGEQTIQGALQAALGRVIGESPLPQGSGRTDAGVHALGQVASFQLQAKIPADNLLRALNRTLPTAIRIVDATTVRGTFHARHSTIAKTYEYRVFRESICPPFLARYVHACSWPMDVELLERSALLFEGEHNFLSFAATDPDLASRKALASLELARVLNQNPYQRTDDPLASPTLEPLRKTGAIRTISSSTWEHRQTENGDLLVYRVRGNGFLHRMVRNLVGTMLDVGRGYVDIEAIPTMLAARSRSAAGPTAPAQGLYLHSVEYNDSEPDFRPSTPER
jgi:tRNA pseudouridine38-40 synthase